MSVVPRPQTGFTLIEAMVALIILGIASVGIVRAAEAHVDAIYGLERRAAAQYVAENALAELSLGAQQAIVASDVPMFDWRWSVESELAPSEDPDLRLATVRVRPAGGGATIVTLTGFVDTGETTR